MKSCRPHPLCRLAPTERMRPVVFWLEDIKNDQDQVVLVIFGAASQIRTGDLILTKDALYRLSYSSIFDSF